MSHRCPQSVVLLEDLKVVSSESGVIEHSDSHGFRPLGNPTPYEETRPQDQVAASQRERKTGNLIPEHSGLDEVETRTERWAGSVSSSDAEAQEMSGFP
jgi:hypothetical protein